MNANVLFYVFPLFQIELNLYQRNRVVIVDANQLLNSQRRPSVSLDSVKSEEKNKVTVEHKRLYSFSKHCKQTYLRPFILNRNVY